jgi:hypothetical protein
MWTDWKEGRTVFCAKLGKRKDLEAKEEGLECLRINVNRNL